MRYNVLKSCAALSCRACVDETTCVAEQYLTLRTGCSRGRTPKVVRPQQRKNPLPYSFSQRSHIGNLRQIRKQGKGRSSKRKENRRLSFLFAPAAGAATFPPSADGESPAEVQRKTPRPLGANPLTQFVCPGQPVQRKEPPVRANTLTQFAHPAQPVLKKLPPGQGEPPARFRCPNRPVQKKGDARTGRSAYAPRVHQKAGAAKKSAAHGHMSTHEDQIFLRFTL